MKPSHPPARERIGQVSLYQHHGARYTYHRPGGKPIRVNWGPELARAQVAASLMNAGLTAADAGVAVDRQMTALVATVGAGTHNPGTLATQLSPDAANAVACTTTVLALRQAFLEHHDKVLGSSLATVSRYRAAAAHLETFAAKNKSSTATGVEGSAFVEFLRSLEVTPNGHPHTARRRLRDRGIRFILETGRSLYRFGLQKGPLPKEFTSPFAPLGIDHGAAAAGRVACESQASGTSMAAGGAESAQETA